MPGSENDVAGDQRATARSRAHKPDAGHRRSMRIEGTVVDPHRGTGDGLLGRASPLDRRLFLSRAGESKNGHNAGGSETSSEHDARLSGLAP